MATFGTPLDTIAVKPKFSDVDPTRFYDVLLARPDLDLLQPSIDGRTGLGNLRTWSGGRGDRAHPARWQSAGRTRAADTHDCDMSTSDPVPVE